MDNFFKNKTVSLFYGGRSPEHEVSINSAKTVYPILKSLFETVYLIGVTKSGIYAIQNLNEDYSINNNFILNEQINDKNEISFIASKGIFLNNQKINIDLAFILIHGNEGEDGKLQGLLEIMNIKYTGVNSTSSGICMYKELTNLILKAKNIRCVETIVISKKDNIPSLKSIIDKLGPSLFIKSETTGSSVGICALENPTETSLNKAILDSFKYSERVLIQPYMKNIEELEVAMLELNNNKVIAAGPGLVVKSNMQDILSYDKKYGLDDCATMNTKIIKDIKLINELKLIATNIFKYLNLSGFCRIDFFYKDKTIYLNEINTIPGLTSKSHYPILIQSANYSLEEAIYEICRTAYDR